MVGLLGTVIGIWREFTQISKKDMLAAQMEFAGGTAEALVNTAFGLAIAIPCMVIYSVYKGRVNTLISELEAAATHIMALLSAQYKRVTAQARAAAQQQAAAQPAARQR
jgi:biopolymer transport protein ExbB